jgi:predicted N-acyltransferase
MPKNSSTTTRDATRPMTLVRIGGALSDIAASQWDALHNGCNPFIAHAFLSGLEQHGALRTQNGWTACHLTLWDDDALIAAAPGYLKDNSHGEFVFDHAWAHAYARHGQEYFPKWLCAVPYTPVTGPRLLAKNNDARGLLLQAIQTMTRNADLSSAHVNFTDACDDEVFGDGWLSRIDVQYHWRNTSTWVDFDSFLAAMDHKHRKNIRQERAKVARVGITFRILHGDEASETELAAMHRFYLHTFADYGNMPTLTLEFLRHLAQSMPRQLVLFLAERDGQLVAGALCLRGGDTLYGRYWGSDATLDHDRIPGLHFETCYYQGIDYCLREGLTIFEPGAQGEHKLARGFLPTLVRSRHWIADPAFAEALAPWCAEERASVLRYKALLDTHLPYRAP